MNTHTFCKPLYLLCSMILLCAAGCTDNAEGQLERARSKLLTNQVIKYHEAILWRNPMGKMDTMRADCALLRQANERFGAEYVRIANRTDLIFVNEGFLRVKHHERLVEILSEEDRAQTTANLENMNFVKYAPPILLQQTAWHYLGDTVINGSTLKHYFMLEADTVFETNKIRTEAHIYLNTSTALIESAERRNHVNDELTQLIRYQFSDYDLIAERIPYTYSWPEGYSSVKSDKIERPQVLQSGVKAPDFTAKTLDGDTFRLTDFEGQKILLDFSSLYCGACKMALDHFNRSEYNMPEDMTVIYLDAETKSNVLAYAQRVDIPFPIIAEAADIGKTYGVYTNPTFFLINEQGIIEEVVIGYYSSFLERISTRL